MFHIDKNSAIYADMRSEETGTPLAELADVLMRTKGVTFASQRFGTRVHAQRLGADGLMRLWRRGVAERGREGGKRGEIAVGGKDGGDGERDTRGDEVFEDPGDERGSGSGLKRVSRGRLHGGERRSVW